MPLTVRKTAFLGRTKGRAGRSFRATCMKSVKIGTAVAAPASPPPSERLSSKPTKTPTTMSLEKPTNQAERYSFVVPVLPPTQGPRPRALAPVPRWITPSSMELI
ncbi:hypothetical protein D3C85_1629040 [compost metagenome]